jgi:hypothetical protein
LGGLGYFADKGFVRASYNYYTSRYGVPFAGLIESGFESNDEEIDLKLRRHNYRVNAGFREVNSFVTAAISRLITPIIAITKLPITSPEHNLTMTLFPTAAFSSRKDTAN